MTNHPRYSPPPPQPGRRPDVNQPAGPGYPGQQHHVGYQQQPYDWRYAQQPYRQPYDPYRGVGQAPLMPPHAQPPRPTQKRSRAGALMAGALAVAIVSAGIGGGGALVAQPHGPAAGSSSLT